MNTSGFNLSLGLSITATDSCTFDTSLSLRPTASETRRLPPLLNIDVNKAAAVDDDSSDLTSSQSQTAASSFSRRCQKRVRGMTTTAVVVDDLELHKSNYRVVGDEDDDGGDGGAGGAGGGFRKKLRLTTDQSALLEHSFKTHTTLNPRQKHALARELNLRPRQVEVWFQNRRARTKLKQTEMDYEVLKKCCDALRGENRSLMKELQELKAMKLGQALYMRLPAATLTMCPSCERVESSGSSSSATKQLFSLPKPNNLPLFPHFANSSAAC